MTARIIGTLIANVIFLLFVAIGLYIVYLLIKLLKAAIKKLEEK